MWIASHTVFQVVIIVAVLINCITLAAQVLYLHCTHVKCGGQKDDVAGSYCTEQHSHCNTEFLGIIVNNCINCIGYTTLAIWLLTGIAVSI